MSGIEVRLVKVAILARLAELPSVSIYSDEVPDQVPVKTTEGMPDPSGRAADYVHVTFGHRRDTPSGDAQLSSFNPEALVRIYLTAAGGYEDDVLHVSTLLDDLLHDWTPEVTGYQSSAVTPTPGYDAGPTRLDTSVSPHRWYLPLQYQLLVHL